MPTINQHFNGRNSLAYLGVMAFEPTDFIVQRRDPLTTDFRNVYLGTWWLNAATNRLWYLANLNNNVATWINLFVSSTLQTITGDSGSAVSPDSLGTIHILSGSPAFSVDGNLATNTLTLNGLLFANQYVTDSGTAIPSAGILNIVGGLNINTSGAGNTVTVKTPTLSEGVIYANSSGVYTSLSKGNNGQTLIASTAGTPAWANIASADASVTITNGAHSINLEAATPPTGITVAFSAYKSASSSNVTGDGTQYFYVCNTELFDLDGSYNSGTGIFTAPSNGDYSFNLSCTVNKVSASSTIPIILGFLTSTAADYRVVQNNAKFNITPYQNGGSVTLNMTAGMTIKPYVTVSTTTLTVEVVGGVTLLTSFSGFKFNT